MCNCTEQKQFTKKYSTSVQINTTNTVHTYKTETDYKSTVQLWRTKAALKKILIIRREQTQFTKYALQLY